MLRVDNSVPDRVYEVQQRFLIGRQVVRALDLHWIHFAVDVRIQQRFDCAVQRVVQILQQNSNVCDM